MLYILRRLRFRCNLQSAAQRATESRSFWSVMTSFDVTILRKFDLRTCIAALNPDFLGVDIFLPGDMRWPWPVLFRAPLALRIFHHLLGGGFEHPPSISAPIWSYLEKNEKKNVRKLVKNDYETISVNFSSGQNCGPLGQKWPNFRVFAIVKHRFGKPPLSRETL